MNWSGIIVNFKEKTSELLDKYIGESREYAGFLTFLITFGISLLGAILRFCIFIYYWGRTHYWELPKEIISVNSNNIFYELIVYSVIASIIFLINRSVYKRLKKSHKRNIVIFVSSFIVFFILILAAISASKLSSLFSNIITFFLSLYIALYYPACSIYAGDVIFDYFNRKKAKKEQKKKEKHKIYNTTEIANEKTEDKNAEEVKKTYMKKSTLYFVTFIITAAITFCLISFIGYLHEKEKTDFRVVEMNENYTYAIVYETDNVYYISPCTIEDSKIIQIDKNIKKIVAKENIEYTHYRYEQ